MRTSLLDRSTTHVRLTEAGRILLAAVNEMDQTWIRTRGRIADLKHPRKRVVVGLYREVPGVMATRVENAAPDVNWNFRYFADVRKGFEEMRAGTVDLFLWQSWRSPAVPWSLDLSELVTEDVAREDLWLQMRAGHPLADQEVVALSDAVLFPWISPIADQADQMKAIWRSLLGGSLPRFEHDVDAMDHMAQLVASTDTVCVGPPGNRPVEGLVVRPLAPAPQSRYSVSWRPLPALGHYGRRFLRCYRERYAEKIREWNPKHWSHVLAHPDAYPGIALPVNED